METPVRRMTRSQTGASGPSPASAVKPPALPTSGSKKMGVSRRALSDLTNDSPISGLMPSGMSSNAGCIYESTPRSKLRPAGQGEDLLRNQVTNLLRKVESGVSKMPGPLSLQRDAEVFESPMRLAAPTPANTPATSWPSAQKDVTVSLPESRVSVDSGPKPSVPQIVIASPVCSLEVVLPLSGRSSSVPKVEGVSAALEVTATREAVAIAQPTTRTLQFDSPEKNTQSCSAEFCYSGDDESFTRALEFESPMKTILHNNVAPTASSQLDVEEDDCGWSVIVNVNSPDNLRMDDSATTSEDFEALEFLDNVFVDEEQAENEKADIWQRRPTPKKTVDEDDYEDCEADYENYSADGAEEAYEDGSDETFDLACEELCRGISHITMGTPESKGLPDFEGKHTRFNYNSDDEIEEVVVVDRKLDSPGKTRLKGLPTPKGKHLRFPEDDCDNSN